LTNLIASLAAASLGQVHVTEKVTSIWRSRFAPEGTVRGRLGSTSARWQSLRIDLRPREATDANKTA
jgi:hypothetical protein